MELAVSECAIIGVLVGEELDDEVLVEDLEDVAVLVGGGLAVLEVVEHLGEGGVGKETAEV